MTGGLDTSSAPESVLTSEASRELIVVKSHDADLALSNMINNATLKRHAIVVRLDQGRGGRSNPVKASVISTVKFFGSIDCMANPGRRSEHIRNMQSPERCGDPTSSPDRALANPAQASSGAYRWEQLPLSDNREINLLIRGCIRLLMNALLFFSLQNVWGWDQNERTRGPGQNSFWPMYPNRKQSGKQ